MAQAELDPKLREEMAANAPGDNKYGISGELKRKNELMVAAAKKHAEQESLSDENLPAGVIVEEEDTNIVSLKEVKEKRDNEKAELIQAGHEALINLTNNSSTKIQKSSKKEIFLANSVEAQDYVFGSKMSEQMLSDIFKDINVRSAIIDLDDYKFEDIKEMPDGPEKEAVTKRLVEYSKNLLEAEKILKESTGIMAEARGQNIEEDMEQILPKANDSLGEISRKVTNIDKKHPYRIAAQNYWHALPDESKDPLGEKREELRQKLYQEVKPLFTQKAEAGTTNSVYIIFEKKFGISRNQHRELIENALKFLKEK